MALGFDVAISMCSEFFAVSLFGRQIRQGEADGDPLTNCVRARNSHKQHRSHTSRQRAKKHAAIGSRAQYAHVAEKIVIISYHIIAKKSSSPHKSKSAL